MASCFTAGGGSISVTLEQLALLLQDAAQEGHIGLAFYGADPEDIPEGMEIRLVVGSMSAQIWPIWTEPLFDDGVIYSALE